MNAQADPRGLGNVLDQFHLRTVVPDPVDVVSFPRALKKPHLLDAGGDPVDQDVFAALGRVDEVEALVRVVRGVGGEVVRDRAGVAVVPVGDPGERAIRGQVHGVGAAPELLRAEQDPFSEQFVICVAKLAAWQSASLGSSAPARTRSPSPSKPRPRPGFRPEAAAFAADVWIGT